MDLKTINKASLLILAGGMGSRYKGQKQIDSVSANGETLMEFALYDAIKVGVRKFVFIINNQFPSEYRNRISNLLLARNCEVHFIEQTLDAFIPESYATKLKNREKPLGTAHAVYCARKIIQEPFITMNADDFYGYNTFKNAYRFISTRKISENEFAMCAFELQNTLSKNGSVSRGLCKLSSANKLLKVEEFTFIENVNGVIKGLNEKLKAKTLKEEDKVSMNFWILHPSFFTMIEQSLEEFLDQHQDLSSIEFFLPSVIDKAIQSKKINVEVLPTSEKWFGLTYPGDKEQVMSELKVKKEKGEYPSSLWEEKRTYL